MNLIQRLAVLGTLAAAGCSSTGNWEEPKVRDKPLAIDTVVEKTEPKAQPKEQPKETPKESPKSIDYKTIDIHIEYECDRKDTAGLFNGLAQGKKDFERIKLAAEIGGADGVITATKLTDYIKRKEIENVKYESTDSTKVVYDGKISVVSGEHKRALDYVNGKSAFQLERITEAAGAYKDQLDKKALDEIQKKLKF